MLVMYRLRIHHQHGPLRLFQAPIGRRQALHGGVIAGGPDAAHGAGHVVTAQRVDELSAAKLRPLSVCRMQPATSPRRATALCSAVVANRDFIRESMQ
jgi:hypothetical protein